MSTFIIGYDLSKPGRDYNGLYNAIRSYSSWAHLLESQWAIVTNKSSGEVREHLGQHLDANDKLVVITGSAPASWTGLAQQISDWLKKNLN